MAKYPREELSYKRFYKNLDLDKDLKINWPKIDKSMEVFYLDEDEQPTIIPNNYINDEWDVDFCIHNGIDADEFSKVIQELDETHLNSVFSRLMNINRISDEEPCDICGLSLESDTKKFVICQGCGIKVHDECYGVPELCYNIWLCRRCIFYSDQLSPCVLCHSSNGCLKKITEGGWCHIVCAELMPGASFSNFLLKEPINLEHIKRLKGICALCNQESNNLIKCSNTNCDKLYHTKCCAENLYSDLNNHVIYCDSHNPLNKPGLVSSKRNLLKDSEHYPDLKKKIMLRHNLPFARIVENEFINVVKADPVVDYNSNNKHFDKIAEYWIEKRKSLGFFNDRFLFANYFLENSK